MIKTISAMKVRQNLGQVMNEVALKEDEYIIERSGKPLVAIIPYGAYQKLLEERKDFFRMAAEMQEKTASDNDEAVIERDIDEAVQNYRKGPST
jgi:prevent-host-death family protein